MIISILCAFVVVVVEGENINFIEDSSSSSSRSSSRFFFLLNVLKKVTLRSSIVDSLKAQSILLAIL